jgi:hypothetical protein
VRRWRLGLLVARGRNPRSPRWREEKKTNSTHRVTTVYHSSKNNQIGECQLTEIVLEAPKRITKGDWEREDKARFVVRLVSVVPTTVKLCGCGVATSVTRYTCA